MIGNAARHREAGRNPVGAPEPQTKLSPDSRAAPRHALTLRSAKFACGAREYLCVIRDISATGVRLRFFHALPRGGVMALQMRAGAAQALSLVWNRGMDAGFRFARPIEPEHFIKEDSPLPRRPLRFGVSLQATLLSQGEQIVAELCDLSLQGAGLICGTHLAQGQAVLLETPYTPIVTARVRWRKDDRYGLVLDDTFGMTELATIIARHHEDCARAPFA